jgi:nucleoside-diphosphate-sugar epimerase
VKVLVTGAAGVMGRRLVRGLLARGFEVRCLVLPRDPLRAELSALGADIEIFEGDISEARTLTGLCEGVDTVYHLAAVILAPDPSVFTRVNREGTRNLLLAARGTSVRHFIYVSSASVTYPRRTAYAESKLAAERLVRAEPGLSFTIVRPTLVYDEHGGQEFVLFRDYLLRFPIVPFIGTGHALKRPVWTEDIVVGLLAIAGNPESYGKLYNFSGGEPISMRDFAQLILDHNGVRKPFVSLPVVLCQLAAVVMKLGMPRPPLTLSAIAGIVNDANLDPSDASRDLGYRPIGVHEGFRRCFPRDGARPLH